MKTLELDLKKKVLIVDLPYNYAYIEDIDINYFKNIDTRETIDISPRTIFLCKGSELTEEIASELVEESYSNLEESIMYRYRSYREGFVAFDNSIESFISAVESKGFYWLENPLGEDYRKIDKIFDSAGKEIIGARLYKWQESEEKTFRNPLIFVKNA